jgi:hypothetical protein
MNDKFINEEFKTREQVVAFLKLTTYDEKIISIIENINKKCQFVDIIKMYIKICESNNETISTTYAYFMAYLSLKTENH